MEISFEELKTLLVGREVDIEGPWEIGQHYLIRTVTMIQVGRLSFIGDKELVLEDAAWIVDTGRFHDCLKDPDSINEAEPFIHPCIVGRGSICDATKWHNVRVVQK